MAITENKYTGNGSTVLYSFTFPYLEIADIKVSLDGTLTTAYTLANATTVQFNTAPANGVAIRIFRQTNDESLNATFYPGSAIRAQDLNDNFTQNLYVTQESNREAETAVTTANAATTTANTAVSTANSAVSTANAATSTATNAATDAATAIATANTASTNASAAVSTANTASTNASNAVTTANTAASQVAGAVSTANSAATAISTANSAAADASTAISTANAATATANTASTNASAAVATANTAATNASNAVTTANAADAKADQAIAAVGNSVLYILVANVAAIPGSPSNNDAVEVYDSTGIESFTPLTNLPSGFVGDSGLSVRLIYNTTGTTWNWIQYFPNDPETRYGDAITTTQGDITTLQSDVGTLQTDVGTLQTDVGTLQTDLSTAQSDILGLDSAKLDATTAASTYLTQANAASTYQTQAGMSSYVATADIGSTVQAYDADTAKLDVAQTFTAQQTFGELKETVYTLSGTAIDPANGSIQTKVLSASTTFTDSLEAGQTIVLMLEGGASYTVTWPTITWVTSAGNAAPTLTAKDTLVLWKVSTTLYGAYVGSYV